MGSFQDFIWWLKYKFHLTNWRKQKIELFYWIKRGQEPLVKITGLEVQPKEVGELYLDQLELKVK